MHLLNVVYFRETLLSIPFDVLTRDPCNSVFPVDTDFDVRKSVLLLAIHLKPVSFSQLFQRFIAGSRAGAHIDALSGTSGGADGFPAAGGCCDHYRLLQSAAPY